MKITVTTISLALALAAQPAWASVESGIDAYNGGDYARAMHDLRPLAENNNAKAQRYVAAMYADGYGVAQDEKTAAGWYLSAATGGDADAQVALGDFYANGRGVVADPVLAAYWHWRASSGMLNAAKRVLNEGLKKSAGVLGKPGAADSAKEAGCSAPAYKADAAHFGQDSSVDLLFLVGAEGKTLEASVGTSSGWPLLDNLARDAFAHCSFPPVLQNGKPVPALIKATYTWKTK
ncbi:MAG: TonB family protein [Burkholderiaceae bacterium]|nr:TonB family protein [Burkholderiaceae bacterium]